MEPHGQLGRETAQEELLNTEISLNSGAHARVSGPTDGLTIVCVGGGSGKSRPGEFGATLEWLVTRLACRFPEVGFAEIRYRVRSWRELESCVEDAGAGLESMVEAGASRCALLGFSMGGAVSVASADHPSVSDVVGLAPWLPEQLDGSTLAGRRFSVVHGQLDSSLPLVPGVSVARTRAAIDRFAARGVETSYTLVRGGVHGLALRAPWGGLIRLPRASAWLAPLASAIERFRVEN